MCLPPKPPLAVVAAGLAPSVSSNKSMSPCDGDVPHFGCLDGDTIDRDEWSGDSLRRLLLRSPCACAKTSIRGLRQCCSSDCFGVPKAIGVHRQCCGVYAARQRADCMTRRGNVDRVSSHVESIFNVSHHGSVDDALPFVRHVVVEVHLRIFSMPRFILSQAVLGLLEEHAVLAP